MPINPINVPNLQLGTLKNNQNVTQVNQSFNNTNFKNILKSAISEVNDAQIQSDVATEKLAKGENIELHQVMITAQKASITMQAALEIRNKAVEAYQEIMRMQV